MGMKLKGNNSIFFSFRTEKWCVLMRTGSMKQNNRTMEEKKRIEKGIEEERKRGVGEETEHKNAAEADCFCCVQLAKCVREICQCAVTRNQCMQLS